MEPVIKKPKILLGYVVTQNVLPIFKEAQQFQSEHLCDLSAFAKVLITDTDETISGFTCIRCPKLRVDGHFCQNAGRNAVLDFASAGDFDGLVILDAEFMLTEPPRLALDNRFSCCRMYWSTEEEIKSCHFELGNALRWTSSSAFILNRPEFLHNRFFEDYIGYGYDDVDFHYNVLLPSGVELDHGTTRAVHYWHSTRSRDAQQESKNRTLYEQRKKEAAIMIEYVFDLSKEADSSEQQFDSVSLIKNHALLLGEGWHGVEVTRHFKKPFSWTNGMAVFYADTTGAREILLRCILPRMVVDRLVYYSINGGPMVRRELISPQEGLFKITLPTNLKNTMATIRVQTSTFVPGAVCKGSPDCRCLGLQVFDFEILYQDQTRLVKSVTDISNYMDLYDNKSKQLYVRLSQGQSAQATKVKYTTNDKLFTLVCHCDQTGFGQHSMLLAEELDRRGLDFNVIPKVKDHKEAITPKKISDRFSTTLSKIIVSLTTIDRPPIFPKNGHVIWYTTWETTQLKPAWVDGLNACDAVVVPCDWNMRCFKEAGVTSQIYVINEALDEEYLNAEINFNHKLFTFVAGGDPGHGSERKGLHHVISCFLEEFKKEDIRLSIKLAPGRVIPNNTDSRISFNNKYLTTKEMREWYQTGCVFVSGSACEGWGLMQSQAMACGLPLIGACYAGQAEYLKECNGYLVDYIEGPAKGENYTNSGKWAILDHDSLKTQMRQAYNEFKLGELRQKAINSKAEVRRLDSKKMTDELMAIVMNPTLAMFDIIRGKAVGRWYHAGDLGDVIYSLPSIKIKGGGRLTLGPKVSFDRYLQPRVGITENVFNFIAPLLRAQPYLTEVNWAATYPQGAGDLNLFRLFWRGALTDMLTAAGKKPPFSLAWMHLVACGIKEWDETSTWLEAAPSLLSKNRVVIHRSSRYNNSAFPWQKIKDFYGDKLLFLGLPEEHRTWCEKFGSVEFMRVKDALDMASLIFGADLFVGNQSFPMAIALGLGCNIIQEARNSDKPDADCIFERKNVQYVLDGNVRLS